MQRIDDILTFWFGSPDVLDHGQLPDDQTSIWFAGGDEVDQAIENEFGDDVRRALDGAYKDWADSAHGRLALILLLDQFTRNIFRGTPRAFAGDPRALGLALDGIDRSHDISLDPIGRVFLYMPLEHAEEIGHQERCVQLMESLVDEVDDDRRSLFDGFYDYAVDHRDIIEKFGRFPHRNPILSRTSSPKEQTYLDESGQNFGQSS